ncbi:3-phosphoshikimate 1-carboxyvinyltransferase [Trebonia kvetii]|uniref:3-phosphoshikimate 1-carboxyvinyltransferase n=1 Tax=Trebonia kvetii TaxID=2480626 RepID=A0A6P2BY43_9ACTN|nr:3-phosphoshikimate 1-carboxyvinyltransferase [Trebonia kvetii]TVZ04069.1 3-phosphoshikimate 1-carboxyvinyltransferase [Trebonia kvetii]
MDSGRWLAPSALGPVRATLRLPGSKSITNRALILAALSDSPSLVHGVLKARDSSLAIAALRALGCTVEENGADAAITPGALPLGSAVSVDVGNSGTVMRFLPAVAALTPAAVAFDGDPRARERPVGALLSALRTLGVSIDDDGRGALPFTVHGTGSVPGGPVTLDASGSSQLVSGLLLAAPRFTNGVEVRHSGPPVPSLPHIEMTVRMLRDAGASVEAGSSDGDRPDFWRVAPGPVNLGEFTVEPDLSNAGPFLAAALVTGGSVTIRDWPENSLQAADAILDVLTRMGATVTRSATGLTVTGSGTVNGVEADLRDIPEMCLPLTSAAALAAGPSAFTGVGHTRAQETDRLAAIVKEINAMGGEVSELPDGLSIRPRPLHAPAGHAFETYDDHRMVMAAAVLGLGVPGIEVLNVATVGKTFPGFTEAWESLVRGDDS